MKFETTLEERKVLVDAHERWGRAHEYNMAKEELAETITALCHTERDRVPIDKVIAELGDAIVCTAQVIYCETGSLDNLETAIAVSFGKLAAKLENDNPNHRADA